MIGETKDAGWQVGLRRTVPHDADAVWALLLAPEGQRVWLGGVADLEPGRPFAFEDGTRGEVRVHRPGSHVRLTWQPPELDEPSVVQVRVLPAKRGATLSFHQERLAGPQERAAMRERWERVAEALASRLAPSR